MANTFNDTTIRDDKTLALGTGGDLKFEYNSVDDRVEVSDDAVGIFMHITAQVMRWLDEKYFELGTGGDIRVEYDAATNEFQIQDSAGVALFTINATTGAAVFKQRVTFNKLAGFGAVADYTISGGVITVTNGNVRIDTEAAAATDDLDTISGGADGDVIMLRIANAARDVVVKNGTNIKLVGGDCTLSAVEDRLLLEHDGTNWKQLAPRCVRELSGLGPVDDVTISAGVITITASGNVRVDTEAAAASDDLNTITGGKDGDKIVICAANSARTVVMKDGTGNMLLAGDFSLGDVSDTISLRRLGSTWYETSRSENTASIGHGTYTPTGTAVANVTALTPTVCHYSRVGNTVHVGGQVAVTATANSTYTRGRLTLPISSNFGNTRDCAGSCGGITSTADNVMGLVLADAANNEIEFKYVSDAAAAGVSRTFQFNCTYVII